VACGFLTAAGTLTALAEDDPSAPIQASASSIVTELRQLETQTATRTWTTAQCGGCHQFESTWSHPVGIVPSMDIPDDLPLLNGRLTCATCHDAESSAMHALARRSHDPLLRGGMEGAAFCLQCHDSTELNHQSQHAMMLGRAHLVPSETLGATEGDVDRRSRQLAGGGDAGPAHGSSTTCLSCHDGSVASFVDHGGAGFSQAPRRAATRGFLDRSHPVSIDYPSDGHRGPLGAAYIPVHQLDERIQLVDGRIECISCHSPYSNLEHQLVMSNHGSALCLSCHDM
jgi:predicted CXXCH cytochrome family protein